MTAPVNTLRVRLGHWPYLAPAAWLLGVWVYLPVLFSIALSVLDWDLVRGEGSYVGWDNFARLLGEPEFRAASVQTLGYAAGLMPFATVAPFAMAVLLWKQGGPAAQVYRALLFLPVVLAPVATAVSWRFLLDPLQARHNRRTGPSPAEIRSRCEEVLAMLELDGLSDRRPWELSGGQRQRVALARAIIRRPGAFLMDEPLSNLDAQLRGQTRTQLVRLHRTLGTTFLYVTHDQVEAMSMATRLVVMNAGEIVQQGSPEEVYERPASTFVARFIGSPPMNLMDVSVGATGAAEGDGVRGWLGGTPGPRIVGWRPGQAGTTAEDGPGLRVSGRVDVVENLGEQRLVTAVAPGGTAFSVLRDPGRHPGLGEEIELDVPGPAVHGFDAATGLRLSSEPARPAPSSAL